jgi:hypothetical protein
MAGREISRVVRTNAGMCAVCQSDSFHFQEFEGWEDWATENASLAASVREGVFVPVNVGGDGVFHVVVRWGDGAERAEAERRYVPASSDPYAFVPADGLPSVGWRMSGMPKPPRGAGMPWLPAGTPSTFT